MNSCPISRHALASGLRKPWASAKWHLPRLGGHGICTRILVTWSLSESDSREAATARSCGRQPAETVINKSENREAVTATVRFLFGVIGKICRRFAALVDLGDVNSDGSRPRLRAAVPSGLHKSHADTSN